MTEQADSDPYEGPVLSYTLDLLVTLPLSSGHNYRPLVQVLREADMLSSKPGEYRTATNPDLDVYPSREVLKECLKTAFDDIGEYIILHQDVLETC